MLKRGSKARLIEGIESYLFMLPWLLGFFAFTIGPMLASFILSFTNYNIFSPPKFIGLENFKEMFTDDSDFTLALGLTFIYVAIAIPIKMISALLVAMLLNQKIRGIGMYRTIYYLPSILGGSVAIAVTWKMVLSREGFLNQFLSVFGLGPYNYLSSPDTSLATLAMITAWEFGATMIIFLSGLKNIPGELYEVAEVDGCGRIRRFFQITLPLISPTILFNLVMSIIGSFQVFSAAYITTGGGPAKSTYFYVLYLYETAFSDFRMGYASALAWVLTVIIIIFTALTFRLSNKYVFYGN